MSWPPTGHRGWQTVSVLGCLAVAASALLHVRGFAGAFLSDDYGYVHVISHMDRDHVLAKYALGHFFAPVAAGNFAYRPLTILSWVIDWLVFGAWPAGWRIQSLMFHLANTALVYAIASRWMFGRVRWHGSAMLPAALFAVFPFAGEAIFWPSSRADVLAALFSLLFLATLDGGPRIGSIRRQAARVILLAAALLSKESALPLAAVALVVDFALRVTRDEPPSRSRLASHVRFVALDLAPSWLIFAAYIAWRTVLFGTPLKVYPQSTLPANPGEYLERLASYAGLFARHAGIDQPWRWALVVAALLVALVGCMIIGSRDSMHRGVPLVYACGLAALVYALSPALLSGVDAEIGDGGRNLYVAWIYLSLALGLAATFTRVGVVTGILAIVWMLAAQGRSLSQWQLAASEMRPLLAGVPSFAQRLRDDQYALLLLPDHVGHALFARNAEGGVVDWPIQEKNYLTVMAGMTEFDVAGWREHFVDGSIARLKGTSDFDMNRFAGVFCWSSSGASFTQVGPAGRIGDFDVWVGDLYARVAISNCMRGTLGSK
jgi:hypothetical protein